MAVKKISQNLKSKRKVFLGSALCVTVILFFQNCSNFESSQPKENQLTQSQLTQTSADSEKLVKALFSVSRALISRSPTISEINQVQSGGLDSYIQIIKNYMTHAEFRDAMIKEHQNYLGVGGNKGDGVDYNMPARLGTYIIMNDKSYKEILTATYCVASNMAPTICDSFSNQADANSNSAGILSTRGLIKTYKTRSGHNFTLTNTLFKRFQCSEYPDISNTQPHPTSDLPEPWNGPTCFGCHNSLNAKAYLYYFYDLEGRYKADGKETTYNKAQDPGSGFSSVTTLIKSGQPPIHSGRRLNTLRDIGEIMVNTEDFAECMVRRYLFYMLGKDPIIGKEPQSVADRQTAKAKQDLVPPGYDYLVQRFKEQNYNIKSLLLDIVTSAHFVTR